MINHNPRNLKFHIFLQYCILQSVLKFVAKVIPAMPLFSCNNYSNIYQSNQVLLTSAIKYVQKYNKIIFCICLDISDVLTTAQKIKSQ
jgi:hypothetical protein